MNSDVLLDRVAATTASVLGARAAEEALSTVNERDHLQPACSSAATLVAAGWDSDLAVSTQSKLSFVEWPRLGSFDVALTQPERKPIVIELKCGAASDALGPCVWDAMKCALALQHKTVSEAYLLAGAPLEQWSKPVRGGEFLATGSWQAAHLRVDYEDWWRHWEKKGDPKPSLLPVSFETVGIGIYPLVVAESPWELRLARVVNAGEESLEWPPFLIAP